MDNEKDVAFFEPKDYAYYYAIAQRLELCLKYAEDELIAAEHALEPTEAEYYKARLNDITIQLQSFYDDVMYWQKFLERRLQEK